MTDSLPPDDHRREAARAQQLVGKSPLFFEEREMAARHG
jgi:hypothetical protein